MKLHSKRVTALASSAMEEIAAAARGRRGYQWLLSASADCTIVLSHLVVADSSAGTTTANLRMELQPLQVILVSEPVYRTFCYVQPADGFTDNASHSSSSNTSTSSSGSSGTGQRYIVGLTAHHALRFPWPHKWQKRGDHRHFFRFKQKFYSARRKQLPKGCAVVTFPRLLQPFQSFDLPSHCRLYLAPRGKLFDTSIPAHQKRRPKTFTVPKPKKEVDPKEAKKVSLRKNKSNIVYWRRGSVGGGVVHLNVFKCPVCRW